VPLGSLAISASTASRERAMDVVAETVEVSMPTLVHHLRTQAAGATSRCKGGPASRRRHSGLSTGRRCCEEFDIRFRSLALANTSASVGM